MHKNQQTLEKEVLQQLIGEESDDGMPVILAKRIDPAIPTTYNLKDYGFEGLVEKGTDVNGKPIWEPHRNFVLVIDGRTGRCRIPDTKNNRARLERLSVTEQRPVTRVVLNEATGKTETIEEMELVPATYTLMEQDLAQSPLVESVTAKILANEGLLDAIVAKLRKDGALDEIAPSPAKRGRKPNPDNLLDPIK